ncbi:hypothetical protein BDW74DRAFT_174324 [Aspergillus multicolor]|uniref:uncharacterized protein n=1 Tax=Aspergillus multicolor TaxID=41759 RepID=UPI003CCD980E
MTQPQTHELLLPISGLGLTPTSRSHWSFLLRTPSASYGDLLHVQPISLAPLWYQFDAREGIDISSFQAEGMAKIADLTTEQRRQVIKIIRAEPAPRDGKRRCQDWVVDVLVSLEVEELVPPGTAGVWGAMLGKGAREVRGCFWGRGWVDLR